MKGSKTVIKVDRQQQAQSFIRYLNQNDGQVELHRLDW